MGMEGGDLLLPCLPRGAEVCRLRVQPIRTDWKLCADLSQRALVPACCNESLSKSRSLVERARDPCLTVLTQRVSNRRTQARKFTELLTALVVAVLPCAGSHAGIIQQAQRAVIGR